MNKSPTATKLKALNADESEILQSLTDTKLNTNDLASRAGSNLRVIAIRESTYKDLREFALTYDSHPTFDTIIRKLFEAYKTKK
jgi:hypothetical protein